MTTTPTALSRLSEAQRDRDDNHKTATAPAAERVSRRSQESRTRESKQRLLEATIDVLLRKGYNGLTTKEVARTAGLSNGALMHHYSNKAELVVAATAAVYDECIARGQRIAREPEAVNDPVRGFIRDSQSVYFEWPFLAAIEVIMVARTDPALMDRIKPVMAHYRETINAIWLEVFKQAGYSMDTAVLVLNLSLNITRGMALNRLWQQDDAHYQTFLNQWVEIVYQQFPRPNQK